MIEFDWTDYTKDDHQIWLNDMSHNLLSEDDIYGMVYVKNGDDEYIIDIHYEYYNSRDKGFDFEVYYGYSGHGKWIDGINRRTCNTPINTEKNYERFQKRAEKIITDYFNHKEV